VSMLTLELKKVLCQSLQSYWSYHLRLVQRVGTVHEPGRPLQTVSAQDSAIMLYHSHLSSHPEKHDAERCGREARAVDWHLAITRKCLLEQK